MTSLTEYAEICSVLAPSLVVATAVGVAASTMGVFVMLRREAMMALALPQTVAVGAALALRLGWPSLPLALASVGMAVGLISMSKRRGADHWLLPSLYIAALCVSFLIISNSGQHVAEMQALFTGIDVAVSPEQAWLSVPILLIAVGVGAMLWRRWLLIAQAPATAEVNGLKPERWNIGFWVYSQPSF